MKFRSHFTLSYTRKTNPHNTAIYGIIEPMHSPTVPNGDGYHYKKPSRFRTRTNPLSASPLFLNKTYTSRQVFIPPESAISRYLTH